MIAPELESRMAGFIQEQAAKFADPAAPVFPADPFWSGLAAKGTELWLDTGDIEAAAKLWSGDFSGLTTNNTLLNKEIQKGIYDPLVERSRPVVQSLPFEEQILEIGFMLNAIHGLRLVHRFGARVSVELHTALAHNVEATLHYAHRFAALCAGFVVKVPFPPSGLIATRRLRREGVPVNMTLGFGARQNAVAAHFSTPSFLNVFLGRLNAFAETHRLLNADYLGERATLASQDYLRRIGSPTRQIAASLRSADQLERLAGVDVHTIPVAVAAEALAKLGGAWGRGMDVAGMKDAEPPVAKVYAISYHELAFADQQCADPPETGAELVERARAAGAGDLFPDLSAGELETIAADGKIPEHEKWAGRMAAGELALDSLMNLAGLASFARDQQALDDRIAGLLRS